MHFLGVKLHTKHLHSSSSQSSSSSNTERTCSTLNKLPCTLEPSLVSSLCLADVELTALHGGRDELVFAAFIPVGCPRQHRHEVVLCSINHRGRSLQYVGSCHRPGFESTLIRFILAGELTLTHHFRIQQTQHMHFYL